MSAFCQMATGTYVSKLPYVKFLYFSNHFIKSIGLQTILFALKTNDANLNSPAGLNNEDITVDLVSATSDQTNRVPQPILSVSTGGSTTPSNETSPKKTSEPTEKVVSYVLNIGNMYLPTYSCLMIF